MSTHAHPIPLRGANDSVAIRLRNGLIADLRPLGYDEVESLNAVFDGLSPQSRADRYFAGIPRLTAAMTAALTDVDHRRHIAWLGSVHGRPAGIARAIRVTPRTAELAFEVVDSHQGQGLGPALLDAVTTAAAVSGIERVSASVLPNNHRSSRLLALIGLRLAPHDGVLEGESPLRLMERPRVDRAQVVRLAFRPGPAVSRSSWTVVPVAAD
jgi:GNAT superfamily N-acetyltransferase